MNGETLDRAELQGAMNRLVRDSLVPILFGVAAIFFLYIVFDVLLQSPWRLGRMAAWCATLSVLMAATGLCVRRYGLHARWAHPVVALLSCAVLFRLLDDLRTLGPERAIADLDLFIVAIGCIVLSWGWLAGIVTLAVAAWMGVLLARYEVIPAANIAFSLPGALVLSGLVHHVRWKTYARFEEMRRHDERLNASLREARDAAMRNEAELTLQNRLMSGILENLPVLAFRIDRGGFVRQLLGKGVHRFGLTTEEGVGRNTFDETPAAREPLERAMRGEMVVYAVSGVGPEGAWAFECFATADRSPDGGALGFGIDITDRRQADIERIRRSWFDRLVIELSSQLLSRPSNEIDSTVNSGLEEMAKFLNSDAGWLIPLDEAPERVVESHRWSRLNERNDDAITGSAWLRERLLAESAIRCAGRAEIPAAAADVRSWMERADCESLAGIALGHGDRPAVGLVFVSVRADEFLSGDVPQQLQIFGDLCVHALERKRAEDSLRESEARLQQVMDHSGAMIFIKDLEGKYLFVNRLVERTFGVQNEQMRGRTDALLMPEEAARALRANDRKVIEEGAPLTIEETVPHGDEPHDYLAVKFPLRNARDETVAVCGIATDVTEFKRAEAALRRSETRFRRVFESDAIGIIIGTFDGQITDANEAFLAMTGYTRDDLPLDWHRLTPSEYAAYDALGVEQLQKSGRAAPFSKEYYRKDGSRVPILLGCGLLDAERHETIGFVLDLTPQRRAEEEIQSLTDQLERAGRLGILGEMAVGIAHELNQPLAAIANDANGAILRLSNGGCSPEELSGRLKMIASDAMTASAVIRKVKSFASRKEVVFAPCDVHALIDDALHLARIEARRRGVKIVFNRHAELSHIMADALQITRVILNLVLNAVQAASGVDGRDPNVIVSTRPRGRRHVEIIVQDNGPGIDDSIRERIFQQFVTTREDGLGLGLAMSKSIVDSHSGWLSFATRPDRGTAFRVVLPIKGEIPVRPPSDEGLPVFTGTDA